MENRINHQKPLRIMMMGLRGFPGVQGGIETHAEKLAPRLVKLGCEVEVLTRANYQPDVGPTWQGVRMTKLWAPHSRSLETLVHSLICVLWAAWKRPDVLHVHAIGPAIVTPLARMLGLRVVVTHHGPDYDRQKWGFWARWILKMGEWVGMRCANQRIVISPVIAELVKKKHNQDSILIPNGVDAPEGPTDEEWIAKFGLEKQKYISIVSRLVPEKRHLDLIEAFRLANLPPDWKLAIIGGADHESLYCKTLREKASMVDSIIMTGAQSGATLKALYANSAIFALPSTHEGLPIALLEAMSFGIPAIASDIPANLAVGLPTGNYFKTGDVSSLAKIINEYASKIDEKFIESEAIRKLTLSQFNWDKISQKTLDAYIA